MTSITGASNGYEQIVAMAHRSSARRKMQDQHRALNNDIVKLARRLTQAGMPNDAVMPLLAQISERFRRLDAAIEAKTEATWWVRHGDKWAAGDLKYADHLLGMAAPHDKEDA